MPFYVLRDAIIFSSLNVVIPLFGVESKRTVQHAQDLNLKLVICEAIIIIFNINQIKP